MSRATELQANDVLAFTGPGGGENSILFSDFLKLRSGLQIILPVGNTPLAPPFAFGDGDSGFYEISDDLVGYSGGGTPLGQFALGFFQYGVGGIDASTPSATIPNLLPRTNNPNTGVGHRTTNVGVLIGGAQNCMEFAAIAAAPACAFNGTAAIIKQTGVAVTEAAIHAALVNLGLIAA